MRLPDAAEGIFLDWKWRGHCAGAVGDQCEHSGQLVCSEEWEGSGAPQAVWEPCMPAPPEGGVGHLALGTEDGCDSVSS